MKCDHARKDEKGKKKTATSAACVRALSFSFNLWPVAWVCAAFQLREF